MDENFPKLWQMISISQIARYSAGKHKVARVSAAHALSKKSLLPVQSKILAPLIIFNFPLAHSFHTLLSTDWYTLRSVQRLSGKKR
ncbi:hypothetical protein POVWA2_046030 [Plasmodium ovale wallikeri]|uniref:Uncharacterized protein n=1 Tax=Plasmodium ovale wallikeri TaxID=864142 RepID=A0A1A8ZI07_PLAOA|nr:hypothetical protein POVWA2_046030 [Plasmodium ovale wallikeri]